MNKDNRNYQIDCMKHQLSHKPTTKVDRFKMKKVKKVWVFACAVTTIFGVNAVMDLIPETRAIESIAADESYNEMKLLPSKPYVSSGGSYGTGMAVYAPYEYGDLKYAVIHVGKNTEKKVTNFSEADDQYNGFNEFDADDNIFDESKQKIIEAYISNPIVLHFTNSDGEKIEVSSSENTGNLIEEVKFLINTEIEEKIPKFSHFDNNYKKMTAEYYISEGLNLLNKYQDNPVLAEKGAIKELYEMYEKVDGHKVYDQNLIKQMFKDKEEQNKKFGNLEDVTKKKIEALKLIKDAAPGEIDRATNLANTYLQKAKEEVFKAKNEYNFPEAEPIKKKSTVTKDNIDIKTQEWVNKINAIDVERIKIEKPTLSEIIESDTKITGSGRVGNTITITNDKGDTLGQTEVDKDGKFTLELKDITLSPDEKIIATPSLGDKTGEADEQIVKFDASKHTVEINTIIEGDELLTGSGTVGDDIVVTDKDQKELGKGKVGKDGKFEVKTNRPLVKNETITVTPSIGSHIGTPKDEKVKEKEFKAEEHQPKLNKTKESDKVVSGEGVPGDNIILKDKDGKELGTSTVGKDKKFEIKVNRPLVAGEPLTATPMTDTHKGKDGNTTVLFDPNAHKVVINQPTEGDTVVTGQGTPGDTITITDKGGNKLGEGVVDGNGDYSITVPSLPSGEEITATPSINGNVGNPATATVLPKPEVGGGEDGENIGTPESHKPTINQPTEGDTVVTGKGTPGDTITITDKGGNKLGEGVVDGNGDYSIVVPPLNKGEVITVTPSYNGNTGKSTIIGVKDKNTPLDNSLEHERDIAKQAIDKVATETKNRIDNMCHLSDEEKAKLKDSVDKIAKLGKETIDKLTTIECITTSMKKSIESIEKIGDICDAKTNPTSNQSSNNTTKPSPSVKATSGVNKNTATNSKNSSAASKLPKTGETSDKTLIITGLTMLTAVGGAVYYRKRKEEA